MTSKERLHVLVVSNHQEAKSRFSFAGVYVDRQVESLKNAGIKISRFDIGTSHAPLQVFRNWMKLRAQVRQMNPHIVHGQYGTIVGFLAAIGGRPAVVSFCGSDLLPGASVSFVRMWLGFLLSNLAALRAQRLICKSEELRQALWWHRDHAVVIPNGVDLDFFSPGCQEAARKELGWPLDHPIALFNRGQDPQNKGLDLAEAAMKVARSRVPDAELHVLSNVKPHMMPLYYRAADVLLCASKQEGSPNMVKEALACNLPVVSAPIGDVQERLKSVHPSAIVPREANAMGEALARILLMRARNNGREHVENLTLDQIARQVLDVYRSALAGHH